MAGATYRDGVFKGEKTAVIYHRLSDTDHKYSVSVIEPMSVKDEDGVIVPSSFSFECEKGDAAGFVAMGGDRSQSFNQDVIRYCLIEF